MSDEPFLLIDGMGIRRPSTRRPSCRHPRGTGKPGSIARWRLG